MMRGVVLSLALCLGGIASAQDIALPDMGQIREDPKLDLTLELPVIVQQATAAAEDPTWFDTFPATSPITRQVAKNYTLGRAGLLTRATIELQLAIDIANKFSPSEIMTIYGQGIYLGQQCYGFEAAITHRMGTSLAQVTPREAITLAALISFPSMDPASAQMALRFERIVTQGAQAGFWDQATAEALITAGPAPILPDKRCPPAY